MVENYDWLFRRHVIGTRTAPNLLVLHPLERSDGTEEGKPRESAYEWYRRLAAGQWGVLFVECTTCSDDPAERGHSPHGFLMTESNLPDFKRLVREIKEVSPETILMIQLSTGSPGNDLGEGNENFMKLPSPVITRLLGSIVKGGVLAAEAGFDGMDLKLCHGHLTFQLLREANKRRDEWGGGTLRQRARFTIEAVKSIRDGLTNNGKEGFIIGARISESNLANLRDIVEVLDKDLGLDFISVSHTNVFNADAISVLTQVVRMMEPRAVIIQAGFTSYLANNGNPVEKMRLALQSRLAPDFVGFGRQAIADPLTPKKLRNGQFEEINWCKRCNSCFRQKECEHYGKK